MFYSIGYAKIKYDWGVKLLEMLKYGTIGVLYCSKRKYKVWLGFSLIESANVLLGFYSIENAKIGYG